MLGVFLLGMPTVLLAGVMTESAGAATPTTINLGTAAAASVLAGAGVTNTGPSVLNRDLDTSPTPAITGFPPGTVGGTIHAGDATAAQAQSDLTIAYNAAASAPSTQNVTGVDLGGKTLTQGVYTASTSMALNGPLPLTLNGGASSVFIFQAGTTLITGSNSSVLLTGGAQACNVFWQVGSSATLGTNTTFVGNILAQASITANTGATIDGRALARTGAVTLDNNVFTSSGCVATSPPSPVTPAPVTPAPVTPAPVTPVPVTPVPVTTAPSTPAPVTPGPVTPVPVTTAPATPAPVTPGPLTPVPVTTAPGTPSSGAPTGTGPTAGTPAAGPNAPTPTAASPTGVGSSGKTSTPRTNASPSSPTPAPAATPPVFLGGSGATLIASPAVVGPPRTGGAPIPGRRGGWLTGLGVIMLGALGATALGLVAREACRPPLVRR